MYELNSIIDSLPKGLISIILTDSVAVIDDSCRSITVAIESSGKIVFRYNPEFWERCTFEEKRFCILHEIVHILLDHTSRISRVRESNVAADLVTNHLLTNIYKIVNRDDIRFAKELCWVDTVFRRHRVGVGETFEHYYNKLETLPRINHKRTLDDHDFEIDKAGLEIVKDRLRATFLRKPEVDESIEEIDEKLLENFLMISVDWSRILSNIFGRFSPGKSLKWTHNKKLDQILGELILPSEVYDPQVPSTRATIFVDTSKSCTDYVTGFMRSLKHIPNHIQYDVKGFCGRVYDINKRVPKLYTGITSFSAIEAYLKKQKVYPDCIVILTDGYGDTVKPSFPKRWNWVLVKPCTTYVHKESKVFHAHVQ